MINWNTIKISPNSRNNEIKKDFNKIIYLIYLEIIINTLILII